MTEENIPRIDQVPPYPLAMIVCDGVHRDPATGKVYLLGCFSTIKARAFPTLHPVLCVYAALTDGHGKLPIKLRLVDADEARAPVLELDGEADFKEPRAVLDFFFAVHNVIFPEPGEYRLQLYAAGQHVIERRILVMGLSGEAAGGKNDQQ